jgi:hypothetical protein
MAWEGGELKYRSTNKRFNPIYRYTQDFAMGGPRVPVLDEVGEPKIFGDAGICVGRSALWCSRFLKGLENFKGPPDHMPSTALHTKWELIQDQTLNPNDRLSRLDAELQADAGLMALLTEHASGNVTLGMRKICQSLNDGGAGAYMLLDPFHCIAANVSDDNNNNLVFDCNLGLYKYPSPSQLKSAIRTYWEQKFAIEKGKKLGWGWYLLQVASM